MEADFRVDSIFVDEELGEMFAKCYDNVYGEEFEKFLGSPDTEEGRQNALTILEDGTYTMTDELRNEFISTFGLDDYGQEIIEVEEEDEFYDDSEDEVVESFSIREALNKIDLYNDNKYDLLNLYESCTLNESEKRELGRLLYDQADSSVIYDTLNKKYISEHYDDCPELYDELFGKLENMGLVINKTLNLSEDELDGEYVDETLDTLEDFVDEAKDIVDDIKEHKNLDEDLDKETLKSKLEKATREFVTNTLGYDDDFVDDYIFVEVKEDKFSDGSEAIKCEIRTELDYEECVDLSTHLNPILFAEDKYAYFDMEDPHTLSAYIRTDFSDDVVDEETVNEYADLIKDVSSMEELRKLYKDIRDLFEDRWTSATLAKVHDLVMDKADELNSESKPINESGYKLTIEKDGETFTDYCYDYREESAIAQMKAKYGDDISIKNVEEHISVDSPMYREVNEDINDSDEVLTFKRDINLANDADEIQQLIYELSDGVAEDNAQQAFNENESSDLETLKSAVVTAIDVYLEDNEWLGESKSINEDFADITALADDCGKNTFKISTRDIRFTFENEEDKTKFVNELLSSNIPHNELTFGIVSINKSDALDESKSINESDEETPYTKEEVERDLKSITHNFTDKEGELKCGFEEEKNFGVEILKQHYKVVEVSGDDRRDGTWYHISFANPIEDKSMDEGYELLSGNKVEVYSDYDIAKKRAEELGLKEAEYGDIYRSNYSYCFWNETGDRNDDEQVIAYYAFEDGKSRPLTEDEREEVISKYEIGSFDNV